jgi:hypothetical protein
LLNIAFEESVFSSDVFAFEGKSKTKKHSICFSKRKSKQNENFQKNIKESKMQ